jgi:hypothetical protein
MSATATTTDRPAAASAEHELAELARVTDALATAIESDDLDAAERLVQERDALIEAARPRARALATAARARPALGASLAAADARARESASARVEAIRAELAGVATGAEALRGYASGESTTFAPGWIDLTE